MAAPIPLKIVLVGDGGVGKSSITMCLLNRGFSDEYDPTVEDAYSLNMTVDGVDYAIELVDTAGQEEYRGLWSETSAREADGFVVAYSVDSRNSFNLLPDFLHVIRKVRSPHDVPTTALTPENTPFPFLLVGNKCDLPPATRQVTAQDGLTFARQGGGLFSEVSAKARVNIDSSFLLLLRSVARAKSLHALHVARCRGGVDDGLFNPNLGLLDRSAASSPFSPAAGLTAPLSPRGSISGVTYGDGEKGGSTGGGAAARRKKDPNLAMDRRRSLSVGGLGRDPSTLGGKEGHGKGCGCVVS
ncbi:hypothetical protein JCM8547_008875 [Rhodosporidiobolus lusitaniae]